MMKRIASLIGILAVLALGGYLAYDASQLYTYKEVVAGSNTYNLLFTTSYWALLLAVLLGIYTGAKSKNEKSEIVDGKILRNGWATFLIHWSYALATVLLIATAISLGFLFIPRLVNTPQATGFILNLHFVGVLVFLFGVSAHATDVFVTSRLKEHMPSSGDIKDAFAHYASKLGFSKKPREGKYLASEKLSYLLWIILVGLIILTGAIKVSAHIWNIPSGVMGVTTSIHDLAALGIIALLIVHVILGALVPWSWQLLRSMITGYVSEEYAKKYHPEWYEELANREDALNPKDTG